MKDIIDTLRGLTEVLNWQVTTLIILFMVRKHLGLVFTGINNLLNRTTEIFIDGNKIKVVASDASKLEQVKNKLENQKEELKNSLNVVVQAVSEEMMKKNNRWQKNQGLESNVDLKTKDSSKIDDDPQKGKWGGRSTDGNKRLIATVTPLENSPNFFKVKLLVISNDKSKFLGRVKFHLHPSFGNSVRTVDSENGEAQLNLISYGAFTVGVETEDGTKLELDLAEDKSFPEVFRAN